MSDEKQQQTRETEYAQHRQHLARRATARPSGKIYKRARERGRLRNAKHHRDDE